MARILIIRFSALGDVAMTVPVVHSLAAEYPQHEIIVLSRTALQPLFLKLPENVSFYGADLSGKHKGLRGLNSLYAELKGLHFDYVADFHDILRAKYLRWRFRLDGVPVAAICKGRADKKKLVYDVLGALRLELAKQMDLLDKNEYRFVWVTEFPLLEWSEEENSFTAMHHPFTMLMEEDLPLLDTDPGKVRAKAYDIVLNGNEIGGGSVRIHQDDIQERMFEALGFTKEAAHEQFGFLLDAFKYGVPPHAGLAYGLDRLVMLMAKEDSIRDVIAFPKVKDASCLMTEAPSPVDAAQLEELGLEVEPQAEE